MGAHDITQRGVNLLDTGAHFYDAYECADGEYISVGSIEPQFYAELLRLTGFDGDDEFANQMDRSQWPHLKERIAEVFRTKTRDEWCELMEHTDVCFAPVLRLDEAARHPHNVARNTFIEHGGLTQPAPAPRFSRTIPELDRPAAHDGQHTREVLDEWGLASDRVDELLESGAAKQA
jgi:alpha-methylacyl-CoA racemase